MRIIQVLACLSPDNAYGGPATVAIDQCRALAAAGHDVTLAAGAMGYGTGAALPTELDGAPVKLFPIHRLVPRTGFAGLTAPGLGRWLRDQVPSADAVHVHLARDLLTLPAALLAQNLGAPVFSQTHGMVDPSDSPLARVLDTTATRRALRASRTVFVLTEAEGRDVREVAGERVRTEVLANGIVVEGQPPQRHDHGAPLVLFLARLAPRKQPLAFVEAAVALRDRFPHARFRLVGPDEGTGDQVRAAIAASGMADRLQWVGPADREGCARHMAEADVYVLPSVNEPFGMTVLEAMRAGLPAVVTTTCELGPMLERTGSGVASRPDPASLAEAIGGYLADPGARMRAGENARAAVQREFSMNSVREQLERRYAGR